MSTAGGASTDRELALALLRHIVQEHPGLKNRGLKAALKGKRCRVTDLQLENLLAGQEFAMDSSGGWSLVMRHETERRPAMMTPPPTAAQDPAPSRMSVPSGIELSETDLLDVLDVDAIILKDALWVLVANEEGPDFHWSRLSALLRTGQSATFSPRDLRTLREHIKAMKPATVDQTTVTAKDLLRFNVDAANENLSDYGWSVGPGGCAVFQSGPPATHGERLLREVLSALDECLVLLGVTLIGGQDEREVDAVVVTPSVIVTIEQKDVRAGGGSVHVPANGAPVRDGLPLPVLAHARKQSRLHAQRLKSRIIDAGHGGDVGHIRGCLSIQGVDEVSGSGSDVWFSTTDEVDELIQSFRRRNAPSVTYEGALAVLAAFEIRPPESEMLEKPSWAMPPITAD